MVALTKNDRQRNMVGFVVDGHICHVILFSKSQSGFLWCSDCYDYELQVTGFDVDDFLVDLYFYFY